MVDKPLQPCSRGLPLLLALLIGGWVGGCRPASEPASDESSAARMSENARVTDDSMGHVADPPQGSVAEITATVIDRAGYDDFLAKHLGHVILVDLWATWCPPCVEDFPKTVQLREKYRQQGLVVASLALEEPDNLEPVLGFLRQHEARMPNFVSAYGGSDARSADAFQLKSGSIPTLKLYDRSGSLHATFGDGEPFTFEEIEVAVRQLILESNP